MTRERAKELAPIIAAYGEGKEIQYQYSEDEWWPVKAPAIWRDDNVYRIKPEPKKRPMTREEVLGKVTTIVVRHNGCAWAHPGNFAYSPSNNYEWATIDKQGNIGEPHAFETEE